MSWEGFGVSVRCGALGCYQGTILAADGASITLTKPFRNGFPYPKAQVTLKVSDIKSLEIISERAEQAPAPSTVLAARRRGARAPVGESLQPPAPAPAPQGASAGGGGAGRARSKPVDIQGGGKHNKNHAHSGSYGASGGSAARRRDEAAFGASALEAAGEFDFEGNLALFDKEALRARLRPDVVRDAARLRPDQPVLPAAPPPAPLAVPLELRGPAWYVTDGGARVPTLGARARRAAWRALAADGAAGAARVLLARAAADVALRLVGGARRLDPRNAHQRPGAAVAAAQGLPAAAAVEAARILMSHGVDTYVIAPEVPCAAVADALALYEASGGRVQSPTEPRAPADLLLLALADPEHDEPPDAASLELAEWALSSRGALLLLEPGADGAGAGAAGAWARLAGAARAVLQALLPGGAARRVLLADVAPPPRLLRALGVRGQPPFAAALLPLHRADDDD